MSRILVIDDEPLVRDTIKAMLEYDGHDVSLARTGHEGIERFRSQPFDAVICDVFMPELSGLEAISQIRGYSAEVLIIAMSGGFADLPEQRFSSDLFRIVRHKGATLTLAKPFRRAELLRLLRLCFTPSGKHLPLGALADSHLGGAEGSGPPSQINGPKLVWFYDYWTTLRGTRPMPRRDELNEQQLPPEFLLNLMLIDILHGPVRYRWRLLGLNVLAAIGQDCTGRIFDDADRRKVPPGIVQQYDTVVQTGAPRYSTEPFTNLATGATHDVERLLLPFSDDGEHVDQILAVVHFKPQPVVRAGQSSSSCS
jgi:CheY-like chemotaxis protein